MAAAAFGNSTGMGLEARRGEPKGVVGLLRAPGMHRRARARAWPSVAASAKRQAAVGARLRRQGVYRMLEGKWTGASDAVAHRGSVGTWQWARGGPATEIDDGEAAVADGGDRCGRRPWRSPARSEGQRGRGRRRCSFWPRRGGAGEPVAASFTGRWPRRRSVSGEEKGTRQGEGESEARVSSGVLGLPYPLQRRGIRRGVEHRAAAASAMASCGDTGRKTMGMGWAG
jgi:hypothetical protein